MNDYLRPPPKTPKPPPKPPKPPKSIKEDFEGQAEEDFDAIMLEPSLSINPYRPFD